MDGADSFADLFTKELIEPLQAGMPEMDTTITIGVGAKNQIQTMHFEVTPPAEPIDGVTIESLTADFNIAENGDESLTAQAVMSQNGETMTLAMDVSDSYQEDVYKRQPECCTKIHQAVSCDCPIGYVIMDLFRAHVIDVLWIIFTALCFGHTYKLAGLVQDFANAALPNTFIFAARRIYTIHNDACDGAHTVIAFTLSLIHI